MAPTNKSLEFREGISLLSHRWLRKLAVRENDIVGSFPPQRGWLELAYAQLAREGGIKCW